MLVAPNDVSRVIARPFVGEPGGYSTHEKPTRFLDCAAGRDLARRARARPVLPRAGVGKVDDLFAGRAISSTHTANNARASRRSRNGSLNASNGLLFANLVDFDQAFRAPERRSGVLWCAAAVRCGAAGLAGHSYARTICCSSPPITGTIRRRHQPTTHASACRCWRLAGTSNPPRLDAASTFSDLGATVAEWFGIEFRGRGTSFLPQLVAPLDGG